MAKIIQLKDSQGDVFPVVKGQTGDIVMNRAVSLAGFITTGSAGVQFSLPCVYDSTVTKATIKQLALSLRISEGGYPYVRSGTNGGTYTQLAASAITLVSNGAAVRSNELNSWSCTPVCGSLLDFRIVFQYALTKASGNTTAVLNNTPVGITCSYTVTLS